MKFNDLLCITGIFENQSDIENHNLCVEISSDNKSYAEVENIIIHSGKIDGILLKTKEELIPVNESREKVLNPIVHHYHGKKEEIVLRCPKCDGVLRKKDRYCSTCGQRVKEN